MGRPAGRPREGGPLRGQKGGGGGGAGMGGGEGAARGGPLQRRELAGWFLFDWANSSYYQAAISVFVPLLVNSLGEQYAWSQSGKVKAPACSEGGWVAGAEDCLQCVPGRGETLFTAEFPEGTDQDIPTLPGGIPPLSLTFLVIAISVLAQAICFISVGPLGDIGRYRRKGLIITSYVGCISTMLFLVLAVGPQLYWLGAVLALVSNVAMGTSIVFYTSYLPLLVDATPEVIEAREAGDHDKWEEVRDRYDASYSQKGNAVGYAGGSSALLICVIISFLGQSSLDFNLMLSLCIFISGLWWFIFSTVSFKWIRERPGSAKALEGASTRDLVLYGWRSTYDTIKHARGHAQTWMFLLLYFFFSDGYSTIATVAAVFAQRDMCFPITEVTILAIVVPFSAFVGCLFFMWIRNRFKVNFKTLLVTNLLLMAIIPVWGIVGFFTDKVGLRTKAEFWIIAVLYGLNLGSAQSFARSMFGDLIPAGHEAGYFSLYEITDKGSSWLGPLVTSIVVWTTGSIRYSLIYLIIVMIVPSILLQFWVDFDLGKKQAGRMDSKAGYSVRLAAIGPVTAAEPAAAA